MTGAFISVKRGDKHENIEVEYLDNEKREAIFKDKSNEELIRWIELLCNHIIELEQINVKEIINGINRRIKS